MDPLLYAREHDLNSAIRCPPIAHHRKWRSIPIQIGPHIRVVLSASVADEPRPNIGQPYIVRP